MDPNKVWSVSMDFTLHYTTERPRIFARMEGSELFTNIRCLFVSRQINNREKGTRNYHVALLTTVAWVCNCYTLPKMINIFAINDHIPRWCRVPPHPPLQT